MRIALAQLNYRIGDFKSNIDRMVRMVDQAKSQRADLVIFAELSICGYPPRDFLDFEDFIRRCREAVDAVAIHCQGIAAIVGAPSINAAPKGKPLYNTAWFLAEGKVIARRHKTLLPNYDVFDEYRYFEPNREPYEIIEYRGECIALTICEDLWNITDDLLYVRNPMDELATLHPDILINIAASPFNYNQPHLRREILIKNAVKYNLPVVYVNQVGGQTELIFDGGSMVVQPDGAVTTCLKSFEEDFHIVDLQESKHRGRQPVIKEVKSGNKEGRELEVKNFGGLNLPPFDHLISAGTILLIRSALVLGIRDYFGKMGFSKAILGLSGGIDSAVTLVLAAEALGNENVRAVLLPSQFSSEHSVADAIAIAENLRISYDLIPIEEPFYSIEKALQPHFSGLPFNLTEENIQARIRAVILMALSNKFGYILLNTSNKSEAAVGYGTLYGDMCGGLSVLGDVYKTQVYALAQLINADSEIIPLNTIRKPPSAELRPDQKDSDSLPEYNTLDRILYHYIEQCQGPDELTRAGFDRAVIDRVLRLVNTTEYKRYQTPPILRISPKAFGMGRRMPIVAKYLS
jgi:NAD+ synthase (glutamine-hydrolysing)